MTSHTVASPIQFSAIRNFLMATTSQQPHATHVVGSGKAQLNLQATL